MIEEINAKLDEAIPVQYPDKIYEAMRYSVLAQGAKRAPPVMCVAACELFGGHRLAAFPTACALEMVSYWKPYLSIFAICYQYFFFNYFWLIGSTLAVLQSFFFFFSMNLFCKLSRKE